MSEGVSQILQKLALRAPQNTKSQSCHQITNMLAVIRAMNAIRGVVRERTGT